MVGTRWLRWIGPGVVALGAVGFIASTTLGVGVAPWSPRACTGPPGDRVAAARDAGPPSVKEMRGNPWFRLDPVLDGDSALIGQHLSLGLDGERGTRSLDLAPESFAAGPFGRLILAGSDDGRVSHLSAIDVAGGCTWAIAEESCRHPPRDAGPCRCRHLRDAGRSRHPRGSRHLAPAVGRFDPCGARPRTDRRGRTLWADLRDRVLVGSRGRTARRPVVRGDRLSHQGLRAAGRNPALVDDPELGPLVGLVEDRLVTYGACRGWPCPIVSTELGNRERRVLAEAAGAAVVVAAPDGARLVHELQRGPLATCARSRSMVVRRPTSVRSPMTSVSTPLRSGRRRHATAARLGPARARRPDSR